MSGLLNFRFLYGDQPLKIYFYAVSRVCLAPMGYWPEGVPQRRALFNFAVLTIGVLTEFHAGLVFASTNRITLALETFCPAGTSAVTLLKMFFLLNYRKKLHNVLQHLRQLMYSNSNQNIQKEFILRRHSVMAARFNFWPLSAGFFTCTLYNTIPILMVVLLHLQHRDDEVVWNTPFNMTMPDFMLNAPYFPFTYLFIAYTGYITIFMFGGCDAFYFEFCVHIATLFKCLEVDLRALFSSCNGVEQLVDVRLARFECDLVSLIKRQNMIIELTVFFRNIYCIMTMAHFVSASMVIAFSIFLMTTPDNSGLAALLYVGYTVAALSQLFIYCYGGTLVAESSVQLAITMSSCSWQVCPPRLRRYVHLFILRSQRAVTMTVPFFSPSLSTFAAILQTSGSIIALAKSFQ